MQTNMTTTTKAEVFDDPIWEYTLGAKLAKYIPYVRTWWSKYADIDVSHTGVYNMYDMIENAPSGLMYRVTNTPVRSPIKGVQAFPYLPTVLLNMSGVAGGVTRMIERVCLKNFYIEEFSIIEKHNLPSTYHQGQFLAFVPTDVLNSVEELGKFIYITIDEQLQLLNGVIPKSLINKLNKKR